MNARSRMDRPHDVVVWGATGFTGRLVAEYLAQHERQGDAQLRWAIGGRSREKLEGVRREVGAAVGKDLSSVPILVGDAQDTRALGEVAKSTNVVCSTAGPFATLGSELVGACAREGTSYCDITGEVQWVRKMIDAHQAEAERTGARIVSCCGFDSIPSDLGTFVLQEFARKELGAACKDVTLVVGKARGGFSGGTVASMLNIFEEATRDRSVRRVLGDPYALNPDPAERGPDGSDQRGVGRADGGRWTAPFVMAAVNTRVVRRTNALLGYPYGRDFRYREVMGFGRGARGLVQAAAVTAGTTAFAVAAAIPPVRKLLAAKVLPAPGEGPSREKREAGFFNIKLVGSDPGAVAEVKDDRDPGYGSTSKMLGEAALCLAFDEDIERRGGCWTPASCMGLALVQRLRGAGLTFDARAPD